MWFKIQMIESVDSHTIRNRTEPRTGYGLLKRVLWARLIECEADLVDEPARNLRMKGHAV
jgi:hypothetical protein